MPFPCLLPDSDASSSLGSGSNTASLHYAQAASLQAACARPRAESFTSICWFNLHSDPLR